MLTSIMSFNFDAVAFLRFGQNRRAASTLKSALQQLASACPIPPPPPLEVSSSSSNTGAAREDIKNSQEDQEDQPSIFTIKISDSSISSIISSTRDGEDSSQEMFCRAFLFSLTYGQHDSTSNCLNDKISAECAAICLYNLGLCFQLEGIRGHGDSTMLAKSIQLYARAYKVVGDCQLTPNDPLVVVLMAVSINLACIHADLYDLAGAEMWRNTFRSIYTWATRSSSLVSLSSSPSATRLLPWEPEDFSFFSFCAVVFENQKLSSAAAA